MYPGIVTLYPRMNDKIRFSFAPPAAFFFAGKPCASSDAFLGPSPPAARAGSPAAAGAGAGRAGAAQVGGGGVPDAVFRGLSPAAAPATPPAAAVTNNHSPTTFQLVTQMSAS